MSSYSPTPRVPYAPTSVTICFLKSKQLTTTSWRRGCEAVQYARRRLRNRGPSAYFVEDRKCIQRYSLP